MVRFLKQYRHLLDSLITEEIFTQITAPRSEYDSAFSRVKKSKEDVFQAAAFLPSVIVIALLFNKKLLVFDGAYCSSDYGGILLFGQLLMPTRIH